MYSHVRAHQAWRGVALCEIAADVELFTHPFIGVALHLQGGWMFWQNFKGFRWSASSTEEDFPSCPRWEIMAAYDGAQVDCQGTVSFN